MPLRLGYSCVREVRNWEMQSLRELSLEEVEHLRDYEAENRNRRSIMQRFETRIRVVRKNLEKRGDAETEESPGE